MKTDDSSHVIISRKIFINTANLIFYAGKSQKLQSVTVSKWLQIALGTKSVYRLNQLTFDEYLIFIDLCNFKFDLHDRGLHNMKVSHKTFMEWRTRNPNLLTNLESAKSYLQVLNAENVLSEGRQLIAFCDKKYKGKFNRFDFYYWSKVNGFKFSMGLMDKDDLIKLSEIAEENRDRA